MISTPGCEGREDRSSHQNLPAWHDGPGEGEFFGFTMNLICPPGWEIRREDGGPPETMMNTASNGKCLSLREGKGEGCNGDWG